MLYAASRAVASTRIFQYHSSNKLIGFVTIRLLESFGFRLTNSTTSGHNRLQSFFVIVK